MSARGEAQLWVAQRVTAVILAACVAVHLVTIIYAVRSGLGGAELLGRTRGSVGIAVFYGVFVIAASIHGAIGLRAIGIEWLRLRPQVSGMFAFVLALALAGLGMRAVVAVVAA